MREAKKKKKKKQTFINKRNNKENTERTKMSFFKTHLSTADTMEAELFLSKLANDRNIDTLDCSECKNVDIVGLLSVTVLADGGAAFAHIVTLNLGDCSLKKADGEALAKLLGENRTLKKINVANNDLSEAFKSLVKGIETGGTLLSFNYSGNDVSDNKLVESLTKALKKNAEKAAKASGAVANSKDKDKDSGHPNNAAPLLQAKRAAKPAIIARLEMQPGLATSIVNKELPLEWSVDEPTAAPAVAAAAPSPIVAPSPAAAAPVPVAAAAAAPLAAPAPQGPAQVPVAQMTLWQLSNCVVETRAQRFQIHQLQIAGVDVLRNFISNQGPFACLPRIAQLAANVGAAASRDTVLELDACLQVAGSDAFNALHALASIAPDNDTTKLIHPQDVMNTCFAVSQERASIGQMTDVAAQALSQSLASCVNALAGLVGSPLLDGNLMLEEVRRALTNERAHTVKSDAMVRDVRAGLRAVQRELAAASAKMHALRTDQPLPAPTTGAPSADHKTLCVVCFDAQLTLAFNPCGHMCTCEKCGNAVKECPMCRAAIAGRLKVYQP
jgi:hypothetical protein